MSLQKLLARVVLCWCLIMGIKQVMSATELLQIIGYGALYSILTGVNWYLADE